MRGASSGSVLRAACIPALMARRVLVTGATSGIGEATVSRLLRSDWEVLATARRDADLKALEARGCQPIKLDLTEEASIREASRQVGIRSSLDGLVHNAGIGIPGAIEDLDPEAWQQQFGVNVFGPVELTRRLAPALRSGKGRIVFVSSQAAITPVPYYGAYCASKSALEAIADALRFELKESGAEVCIVQPGPVRTEFQGRAGELLERFVDVEASPHSEAYESIDEAIVDNAGSIPVEKVAKAIERGLTSRWVPARVPVGWWAWMGAVLASWLPARLQDRVLGYVFDA